MSKSSKVERKLAAIVFTDIAGFTALSAKDEEKAFELLDLQRSILKPIVNEFKGEWLKEIGDGLLLTFPTVSGAIKCSISIQEAVKNEPNLNLRIGIHEGEITVKEGDVFGDDVNIASRIEPFSAVGGIAISGKVEQNVLSLPQYKSKYIGKPALKGVKQEVKVYCLISHGLPESDISKISAKLEKKSFSNIRKIVLATTGFFFTLIGALIWFIFPLLTLSTASIKDYDKKIAVLYLDNQGDQNESYYSDGLSENIMNRLAKINNLNVVPTFDVKKYKNKVLNLNQIEDELSPDYVLYGNIKKLQEQIRVSVELVNISNRSKIWGDLYEKNTEKIFDIQENITENILSEIDIKFTDIDHKQAINNATENITAYELLLKLKQDNYKISTNIEEINHAINKVNTIIEKDPEYSDALAIKSVLLFMHYNRTQLNLKNNEKHLIKLNEIIENAELAIMYEQENKYANAVLIGALITNLIQSNSVSNKLLIARRTFNEINNFSTLYPDHYAANFFLGFYYLQKNNYPLLSDANDLIEAEKYLVEAYSQAYKSIESQSADPMLKYTYEGISWRLYKLYKKKYKLDKSRKILNESIQFFKDESNFFMLSSVLFQLSKVERQLGNYQKAIDNILLMKKYENSMQNKSMKHLFLYADLNIGLNYAHLNMSEISTEILYKLKENVETAFDNEKINNNRYNDILNYLNVQIGYLDIKSKDYQMALEHFNNSIKYLNRLDDLSSLGITYDKPIRNIQSLVMQAYSNVLLNNTSESKNICLRIEKLLSKTSNLKDYERRIFYYLSQVYKKLNDENNYKIYLNKAYEKYLLINTKIENVEAKLNFKKQVNINQLILEEYNKVFS